MEISLNSQVLCTDGPVGKTVRVIVNPVTKAVSHITVQPRGMGESEHVVPLEDVIESSDGTMKLSVSKNQFYLYPLFVSHRFIDMDEAGLSPEEIEALPEAHQTMNPVLWPFVTAEGHMGTYADVKQIPADELAIYRGLTVEATDGRVGEVADLVVKSENAHVTHIVLHKGHLFGHKDIAIPVSDIDRVDESIVFLKLDKAAVNKLPEIKIKR